MANKNTQFKRLELKRALAAKGGKVSAIGQQMLDNHNKGVSASAVRHGGSRRVFKFISFIGAVPK